VTEHLKDRFRIVLGRFLQRRAERHFQDMVDLIKNFDKDDAKQGKLKQKTDIRKGKLNTDINDLGLDIIEEQDDLEESRNSWRGNALFGSECRN